MAINSENYDIEVKVKGTDDTTYVAVGCLLDQSDLLSKGSRDVATSACKNLGSVDQKSLKKIVYGEGSLTYAYDPLDTTGKKAINDAFDDGKTELTIRVELDDKAVGGTHGTYVSRDVLVKEIATNNGTDNWEETVTFEMTSPYTITAAA